MERPGLKENFFRNPNNRDGAILFHDPNSPSEATKAHEQAQHIVNVTGQKLVEQRGLAPCCWANLPKVHEPNSSWRPE